VLQGREAAFIHHLTALGPDYGFIAMANEHDGIVVQGTIPQAAIDAAAKKSQMSDPALEEKDFISRKEIKKWQLTIKRYMSRTIAPSQENQ
jgi:hypothetical protein